MVDGGTSYVLEGEPGDVDGDTLAEVVGEKDITFDWFGDVLLLGILLNERNSKPIFFEAFVIVFELLILPDKVIFSFGLELDRFCKSDADGDLPSGDIDISLLLSLAIKFCVDNEKTVSLGERGEVGLDLGFDNDNSILRFCTNRFHFSILSTTKEFIVKISTLFEKSDTNFSFNCNCSSCLCFSKIKISVFLCSSCETFNKLSKFSLSSP